MLVFYKERLVFLAMPKTGTTARQSALGPRADMVVTGPPELKHAPLYRYDRFFRPIFEKVCNAEMETLALVREPVSWLGSWYRYRQRPALDGHPNSTAGIDFDEFALAYMKGDRPAFANVGSQAKFLEPRPQGASVTHLFRYEDTDGLERYLSDRLDVKLATKRENVSPGVPPALSPGVEAKLRRKCAAEFELWDSIARA